MMAIKSKENRVPKVRIAAPKSRTLQLRYTCPNTKKEIRIPTGTHNRVEAEQQKKELEAKLLLGQSTKPKRRRTGSPSMDWEDFRERYTEIQLSTLRCKSRTDAENRLDIAERILRPSVLSDVADREALHLLQTRILEGAESRFSRPRSPFTTTGYMKAILAALHWAESMGWLASVPKVRFVKTSKRKHMKGRPVTADEFKEMIKATEKVVGKTAAPSWRYVLRGLWESGLRIGELMSVHWSDSKHIVPEWSNGEHPVLVIPAAMQKNDTEEAIPLLPGFEKLLLLTPEDNREGWIFNPLSLQKKVGRCLTAQRFDAEWIGKVVSKIGKEAGVEVAPVDGKKPAKYASAHDLRRGCADRLIAAGVDERDVAAVMRHASVETTRRHYAPRNVQRTAANINTRLGTDFVQSPKT